MAIQVVKNIEKAYDVFITAKYEGEIVLPECISLENRHYMMSLMNAKGFMCQKDTTFEIEILQEEKVRKVIFVGLGKKEDSGCPYLLKTKLFNLFKTLKGEMVFFAHTLPAALVAEVYEYSQYQFNRYQSEGKQEEKSLTIVTQEALEVVQRQEVIMKSVKMTRDLVNEPANVIYPETLANYAVSVGKECGIEVEVFDEHAARKFGMEAYLAIAQGASKRPRLIVMRYQGDPSSSEVLGLVGKGITYDTGGLCLKTYENMRTMKDDMGGAATVIGVISALATLKVKRNVTVVIAACENAISAESIHPGDVVRSMKGLTIEIDNTDAEGRVTLADAVYFTLKHEKATKLIDVATLTGAVVVALGSVTTGVVTNCDEMYQEFSNVAHKVGERVWRMPNFPEYKEFFKSNIADLKNMGKTAGCSVAAMFIEAFVEKTPWLHLDIAGTAYSDTARGCYTAGATGEMVRSLIEYLSL